MGCLRVSPFVACLALAAALNGALASARGAEPGRKYALLIGVNQYENKDALKQPDLSCAEKDASSLADVLRAGGYAREDVVLMTTAGSPREPLYPRAANVRRELAALAAKCTEADGIVVHFAGYERQFPDSKDYFLCTSDADPADRSTLVALGDVYRELGKCRAGLKLVLIDSCRGREKGLLEPPEGVAAFFACSTRELAGEDANLGHGLFTYQLIQALRGDADANKDGKVTMTELERYVPGRVSKQALQNKQKQAPEMVGDTSRKQPVVTLERR